MAVSDSYTSWPRNNRRYWAETPVAHNRKSCYISLQIGTYLSLTDSATFEAGVRDLLARHLRAAETGALPLHIPREENLYSSHEERHFHPVPELFIQSAGISVMRFPRQTVKCAPGEMLLIPPGVPHVERIQRVAGCFLNHVVMFGERTVTIHEALPHRRGHPTVRRMQQFAVSDSTLVHGYLTDICRAHRESCPNAAAATRGLMMAFLAKMLDLVEKSPELVRNESMKIRQCRRMITEHLSNPAMNVRTLAEWIGCSADYLSHIFHRETGVTITHHLNNKRIMFARNLLKDSSLNISEIAHVCGYRDPGYMTRQFKRRTGTTPREYRHAERAH